MMVAFDVSTLSAPAWFWYAEPPAIYLDLVTYWWLLGPARRMRAPELIFRTTLFLLGASKTYLWVMTFCIRRLLLQRKLTFHGTDSMTHI